MADGDGGLISGITDSIGDLVGSVSALRTQISGLPQVLWGLGDDAIRLLRAPRRFILSTLVEFAIGAVLGLFLDIGAVIADAFGIVTSAFGSAGVSLLTAIASIGNPIIRTVEFINRSIGLFLADTLGIAAPFVIVGLYVLEAALFIRALPPLLVAASDLLGAVPVVGSALDALATFAIEFIGGDDV